jgi:hypothetical protein
MGYDSKGILVIKLKYEHAISFINLVKFIYQMSVLIEIARIKTPYNIRIKSEMYQMIRCTSTNDVF